MIHQLLAGSVPALLDASEHRKALAGLQPGEEPSREPIDLVPREQRVSLEKRPERSRQKDVVRPREVVVKVRAAAEADRAVTVVEGSVCVGEILRIPADLRSRV